MRLRTVSVACAASVALLVGLAPLGLAFEGSGSTHRNVAACDPTAQSVGERGLANRFISAGPLFVPNGAGQGSLSSMSSGSFRGLASKLGVVIRGKRRVNLVVPQRDRDRVFLYYGSLDRSLGPRRPRFQNHPGFRGLQFRPCRDRPFSAWTGGIRVLGNDPVRLFVKVEGVHSRKVLRLGRPIERR